MERLEIGQAREVFERTERVVADVDRAQGGREGVRNLANKVLLREQTSQGGACLQTGELLQPVPLQEHGLEPGVFLEILDLVESFEVEVELVVQLGGAVPAVLLAVGLEPRLRHLVHHDTDDDQREPRARARVKDTRGTARARRGQREI